jgi:hypothetical protein
MLTPSIYRSKAIYMKSLKSARRIGSNSKGSVLESGPQSANSIYVISKVDFINETLKF